MPCLCVCACVFVYGHCTPLVHNFQWNDGLWVLLVIPAKNRVITSLLCDWSIKGRLTPREPGHLASGDWLEGCLLIFSNPLQPTLPSKILPTTSHLQLSSLLLCFAVGPSSEFWSVPPLYCYRCFSEQSFWDLRLTPHSGSLPCCFSTVCEQRLQTHEQTLYPNKHETRRLPTTFTFPIICLNSDVSFLSPLSSQTWLPPADLALPAFISNKPKHTEQNVSSGVTLVICGSQGMKSHPSQHIPLIH